MNTEYPILVFPKPSKPIDRSKLGGGGRRPHVPSAADNAVRLEPMFKEVQTAIANRRINIQDGAGGINPEDVLVLETAGRVEDFYDAVRRVKELEWLLEKDIEREADDNFYDVDDDGNRKEGDLSSRLYLVSTNEKALKQIVSMYKRYVKNPKAKLPEGCGVFKQVFEQLRDVRFWNFKDRLDGSDFMEQWLQNNEAFPENAIKFQVELWYRGSQIKRTDAQARVKTLVEVGGGNVLSTCVIEEIRYHAMLIEMPGGALRQMINDMEENSLILSSEVMYFKAMPQTVIGLEEVELEVNEERKPTEVELGNRPAGEPVVALFDGYPYQHHELLNGRLKIDDPDDFGSQYGVDNRIHGTGMASLIIHGDLSKPGPAMDTPLYVRPITLPYEKKELLPENILAVDMIHRAVRRLFEGEGSQPPAAPKVKIINFSIGDPVRVFHDTMSPMARLLDWLSFKYNVLFVISAGNNPFYELPNEPVLEAIKNKDQKAISEYVTKSLLSKRVEHRLLSPSESINNITVGAVHNDSAAMFDYSTVNPYNCLHPAIYSPFGGGLKNSVKPDLVFDGGRQLYKDDIHSLR